LYDYPLTYLNRDALREYLVTDRYFHALLDTRAFHIHPLNSYILHITDIEVKNQFSIDAGVTALLSPANACSFSDAEEVVVEITNFGTQ
ncbi:hypothetical protein Q6272_29955, partial [Klebsiella pneumoniae]|uniref:hypothetical protein n=1 Tax=Klebsiella pneumoniae TaxID=573 RepID=UPI0027320C53